MRPFDSSKRQDRSTHPEEQPSKKSKLAEIPDPTGLSLGGDILSTAGIALEDELPSYSQNFSHFPLKKESSRIEVLSSSAGRTMMAICEKHGISSSEKNLGLLDLATQDYLSAYIEKLNGLAPLGLESGNLHRQEISDPKRELLEMYEEGVEFSDKDKGVNKKMILSILENPEVGNQHSLY